MSHGLVQYIASNMSCFLQQGAKETTTHDGEANCRGWGGTLLYGVITYLIFNFLHLNEKKVQRNHTQDKDTLCWKLSRRTTVVVKVKKGEKSPILVLLVPWNQYISHNWLGQKCIIWCPGNSNNLNKQDTIKIWEQVVKIQSLSWLILNLRFKVNFSWSFQYSCDPSVKVLLFY